ncbi:MAG: VWA-like domain-containing protein [Lachnospiraceae bacterium]|nr:VWA-like domain-containing protein [Lachnospiraceae bacterium]
MAKNDIESQIREFRLDLLREMPFYGELLSHFEIRESRLVSTAGTDGRVILYNRKFFQELSREECNYVLMHELMHIILRHPYRAFGKQEKIWNVSADYVVNGLMEGLLYRHPKCAGSLTFKKPACGCFMRDYAGQSVEQLYYMINTCNKDKALPLWYRAVTSVWLVIPDFYDPDGDPVILKVKGEDLDLILKLSPEEAQHMMDQLEQWTEEALKNWGDDPSLEGIKKQLFLLKKSGILPWKTILKRFLRECEVMDVSYDHPERKYLHMDLILPGEGRETEEKELEDVWAFIDTSGSISVEEKNGFITQLYHVCKQFHAKINIAYWDVSVHEVYRDVTSTKILQATTAYSGGTDVSAVYDFLNANKIKASVILILTDGYFAEMPEFIVQPYRRKTIVVLSEQGMDCYCKKMGKIALIKKDEGESA